jgi:N5-(cytidine 5'-diphosphoramidyl)-L-glutamine hydrolase
VKPLIAITQRVTEETRYVERRDSLDQRWFDFAHEVGLNLLLLPNHVEQARELVERTRPAGLILSGGNDLIQLGGNTPERDNTEKWTFSHFSKERKPVVGVCRGMQFIQAHYGVRLETVENHVMPEQRITINGHEETVNSYHQFGTRQANDSFSTWAYAADGVIKAIRLRESPVWGIMWHPERMQPFSPRDLNFFAEIFR